MGFVEWYTIVIFFIGATGAAYFTGAGIDPSSDPLIMGFFYRWIILLPIVGRIFGWW